MLKERKRLTIENAQDDTDETDEEYIELLEQIADVEQCVVCKMPLVKFEDNGMSQKYVCMNQHVMTVNAMYQYN